MGAKSPRPQRSQKTSEVSTSEVSTPVGRALAARAIPLREFRHPGPVTSLEQAAEERGQRPSQVVRSILFRLAAEEYLSLIHISEPTRPY